jgi:hypothetical protein
MRKPCRPAGREPSTERLEGQTKGGVDALGFGNCTSVHVGGFVWTGAFTTLHPIAASTNALNGALLARRPDQYKNFTIVGVILMALVGGIGGGVTRDLLLNTVPAALTNPAYIVLCLLLGIIGYRRAYAKGPALPRRLLPIYARHRSHAPGDCPVSCLGKAPAKEPAGVYKHRDSRQSLGRKLRRFRWRGVQPTSSTMTATRTVRSELWAPA